MKITICGSAPSRRAPADYFTGTVWQDPIVEAPEPARVRAATVTFEPGARTNWHIHSAAQLLLVEEGKGRLQEMGSAIVDIPAGQPVLTKPNVLHWHGAAPDQAALQFSVYSGTLEWKDAVTDEQYLGKK